MKKIIFIAFIFLFVIFNASLASTGGKAGVIKGFFETHGADIIQKFAHPISNYHPEKTIITTTSQSATLTLWFNLIGKDYCCIYTAGLNSQNYFSSLLVQKEGAPDHPSFSSCARF